MRKLCIFLSLCLIILGCGKKSVKIGAILPLSGELSSYGEMCLKGINLGVKIINENGGLNGKNIELIVEDDGGIPVRAKECINNLHREKVLCVIGPLTTENVKEVGEFADNNQLPVITPTATGIEATSGREWVWRLSFTDIFQGRCLSKFIKTTLNKNSVCILLDPNNPYSSGLCEEFEKEYNRLGGRILFKGTFATGETLFTEQLMIIKHYNPEAIFIPVFYPEAGRIISQARDLGMKQPFIGGDGLDSPELQKLIGNKPGEVYYSTHFFYNYGGERVQEFLHRYRQEYEEEPQTFSALGYDAIYVICDALKNSRLTSKELNYKIKNVSFLGATGKIDFREAHDPRRSLMILKFEFGKPIEMVTVF